MGQSVLPPLVIAAAVWTDPGRTSSYTDGIVYDCKKEHFQTWSTGLLHSASLGWKADIEVKMAWWWWTPVVCLFLYLLLTFSPKFNYFAKFTYLYLAYILLRYTFPKLQIKYLSRTKLTAWSSWSFCFHDLETHQMGSWRPEYCGWLATL